MSAVAWICGVLLTIGAALALVRMARGPATLDRAVTLDILTATLVVAFLMEASYSRRTDTIPIVVAVLLVGFMGSVMLARFAAREPDEAGRAIMDEPEEDDQ